MKTFLLLITFICLITFPGCKKDGPTEPQPTKPPGYQEDIPWPSLADSPWPMYRADPQNTGRMKGRTITLSGIKNNLPEHIAGGAAVMGTNKILYAVSSHEISGLTAFNLDGRKWLIPKHPSLRSSFFGTPCVLTTDRIYFPFITTESIYIADSNGVALDSVLIPGLEGVPLNVDASSNIYTLGVQKTIYRLKANSLIIEAVVQNPDFRGIGMSISPDSKFLYIGGNTKGVYQIDIASGSINWSFGTHIGLSLPVIDCTGNIYLITSNSSTSNKHGLYSIYPDGSIRWFYQFGMDEAFYYSPTVDKQGNIYFGSDTLFSVNYAGHHNWAVDLNDQIISSGIVCDENGRIFFTAKNRNDENYLKCYSPSGEQILNVFIYQGSDPVFSPTLAESFIVIAPIGEPIFIIR